MTLVLGISTTHNGSVALIENGRVKVAIQAERISRTKRQILELSGDKEILQKCVSYCLESAGLKHENINAIAISTPWDLKEITDIELFNYIGGFPNNYYKTFYVPHHFSHMEYITHYGGKKPGIVLVVDGSGSLEADRGYFNLPELQHEELIEHIHFAGKEVISAYAFDGSKSQLIYRFSPSQAPGESYNIDAGFYLQSVGHYWEWASDYCCGSGNEAGKVMGLAAFGKNNQRTKNNALYLSTDGKLNLRFDRLKKQFTRPNLYGLDLSRSRHHQDLARKVQDETETVLLKLLKILKTKFPTDTLYLSGGVALNVVANERIYKSKLFKSVILNGSVEDNGTSIGAGLAACSYLGYPRQFSKITDYYGKEYSEEEILASLSHYGFQYEHVSEKSLPSIAADLIKNNYIFAWFQGRSEFGPRALGNRSIFANPLSNRTKFVLDSHMKCRDRYRPYAPVVVEEKAKIYFDLDDKSSVMMRNVEVRDSRLVAVKHVDGTARVQTVSESENPRLYKLLLEVEKSIGVPVLLNTSFNRPGEPIVESPSDALNSFSAGSLDYLFLGNILVSRF